MRNLLLRGPRKFARETVRIADDEDVRTGDANTEPAISLSENTIKRTVQTSTKIGKFMKDVSSKKNLRKKKIWNCNVAR